MPEAPDFPVSLEWGLLRGLFPAGAGWSVLAARGLGRYVLCNADNGAPV
ncbi:hypothetical protein CLV76_11443 [Marivita geojedonensis]|nr:hypothetical protein CLV76_11443 [Marivita geojedonensis]